MEKDPEKTGKLLGYPECCIKSRLYFLDRNIKHQHPRVICHSHKNSRKHSFLINNLLNFSSRLGKKEDIEQQERYFTLNKNFPFHLAYLQFIFHVPCFYDCQESIKIGKRIQGY